MPAPRRDPTTPLKQSEGPFQQPVSSRSSGVLARAKDGPTRIGLTEKTGYASVFAARLKEMKKGEYVGITARRGADGNWQALQVLGAWMAGS